MPHTAFPLRIPLVVLIGVAGLAVLAGAAQALPDPCQVALSTHTNAITLGVTAGAGASAAGWGRVEFQSPPLAQVVVNFTAQSSNGWPVSVNPESATLSDVDAVDFTVSVTAPAAAAAGEVGSVRVDARVRINTFACTAPEPAYFTIVVAPYVDVFGARIVNLVEATDPMVIPRAFDIEVDVRSNAAMRVRFTYAPVDGWYVQGPDSILIDPTFKLVATQAVHVVISGGNLQPGFTTFDILLEGEVGPYTADNTPYAGRLGYTVFVHEAEATPGPTSDPLPPLVLAAAVVSIASLMVRRYRRACREEALLQLRQVVTRARAEGRLGEGAPGFGRHPDGRAPGWRSRTQLRP